MNIFDGTYWTLRSTNFVLHARDLDHRFSLGKEAEGGEGILEDDGLEVLGEIRVGEAQDEAQLVARRRVIVGTREGLGQP